MREIAAVGLVGGFREDGAIGAPDELAGFQQGFDQSLAHFILRRNEPSYGRNLFPIQPSARPPRRMPTSRSRSSELKGRNGKLSWKDGAVENAGLLAVS